MNHSKVSSSFFTPINMAFYLLGKVTNANSCDLLVIGGKVDENRLRQAVEITFARHPMLNTTISQFIWPRWIFHKDPLPIAIEYIEENKKSDNELWKQLKENIWGNDIPHNVRPVKVCCTQTPEKAYLQIIGPHHCTDARSGTLLSNEIAETYTGLEEFHGQQKETLKTTSRNTVPSTRNLFRLLLSQYSLSKQAFFFVKAIVQMLLDVVRPDSGLGFKCERKGKTELYRKKLGANKLEIYKQYCKKKGISLHTLFCVTVLRFRDNYNNDKNSKKAKNSGIKGQFKVMDLCTLRPLSAENINDVFDCFVVPYTLRLNSNWSDEEAFEQIGKKLDSVKRGEVMVDLWRLYLLTFFSPFLPSKWYVELVGKKVIKTNIFTTNPGVVAYPFSRFGSLEILDFYNFPQLFPPADLALIYQTYKGSLNLMVLYNDLTFTPESLEKKIITPFLRELDNLVKL